MTPTLFFELANFSAIQPGQMTLFGTRKPAMVWPGSGCYVFPTKLTLTTAAILAIGNSHMAVDDRLRKKA